MKTACRKSPIAASFVWWLAAFVCAQSTPPPASPVQQQKAAVEGARATQTTPQPTSPEAEQKISPKEAEELFRSVDEILQFASKDTSLPIKQPVKRTLTSRDQVVAYITKHMSEDEDAQRLRRSELVLKKFGLLPRDFDLQTFLLALLREQVAGYYDPKTKTVNARRRWRWRAWNRPLRRGCGAAASRTSPRTHSCSSGPVFRPGKMDESGGRRSCRK